MSIWKKRIQQIVFEKPTHDTQPDNGAHVHSGENISATWLNSSAVTSSKGVIKSERDLTSTSWPPLGSTENQYRSPIYELIGSVYRAGPEWVRQIVYTADSRSPGNFLFFEQIAPPRYNLIGSRFDPYKSVRDDPEAAFLCQHVTVPGENTLHLPMLATTQGNKSDPTLKQHRTGRWLNAGLMLGHRLRRWPNINPALSQRPVLAV